MNGSSRGFTIVELTFAVIITGIIAIIGSMAWNGVTQSLRDKTRETDTRAWMTSFENYKNRFYVYPSIPTADGVAGAATVCLGQFTAYNNKCGQYGSSTATAFINASGSASMISELNRVGRVLENTSKPINNTLAGPIAYSTRTSASGTYTVTTQFINFFEGSCPSTFTNINSSLPPSIAQVLTALPSGTSANACAISKTYTYTP